MLSAAKHLLFFIHNLLGLPISDAGDLKKRPKTKQCLLTRFGATNLPYQGTTSVVPPAVRLRSALAAATPNPQGLQALTITGTLRSGTPEGVP